MLNSAKIIFFSLGGFFVVLFIMISVAFAQGGQESPEALAKTLATSAN